MTQSIEKFKLSSGGLLYRLLIFFRAQKLEDYCIRRRIVLFSALTFLPLLLLSAYEGNLINKDFALSFASDFKSSVRFLIVLPLLIVADTVIDPLIVAIMRNISFSGILSDSGKGILERNFSVLVRRKNSVFTDIGILIIALVLVLVGYEKGSSIYFSDSQSTWAAITDGDQYHITLAGWWFLIVSHPVLQILLYRWIWRFLIWVEFMFRVSRIKFELEPSHPDLAGGLGILGYSQNAFVIIFVAIGSLVSLSLAQEILYTDASVAMIKAVVPAFVGASLIITTVPLLFFSRQLFLAKMNGRVAYGALGYKLSRAFGEKWLRGGDSESGRSLLETADSSTVCDYSTVYEFVRTMRVIPVSLRTYAMQAVLLGLPFGPLVFLKLRFTDLLSGLFDALL